jgi:hypothetical protein
VATTKRRTTTKSKTRATKSAARLSTAEARAQASALVEAASGDEARQTALLSALREDLNALVETANLAPAGYVRLGGDGTYRDLDEIDRAEAIEASYYYWQRDPLAGRAVQLIRDYTFGRGVTFKAKDPRVQKVIKDFLADADNKLIASAAGQWEISERVQLSGEWFPIFFVNRFTGHVKVSLVEPEEITQIITDSNNKRKELFYERRWVKRSFNWESKTLSGGRTVCDYLPNFNLQPPKNAGRFEPGFKRIEHASVGDGTTFVAMQHIKINSHGPRGIPLLLRVLPWIKAYKGFMEDRATLTLALATFAFKMSVKGSKSAVARLATQWGTYDAVSRLGGANDKERREGAQTFIANENVNLDQLNTNSNAANAYQDGRMIRQQVGAGVGITEQNLTGDPSVANLASATQMEGPMLKMFESWQQLFHDEFVYIMAFVINMAIQYGDLDPAVPYQDEHGVQHDFDPSVEIDFPPIVSKDLATLISAIAQLISAQSLAGHEYIPPERLAVYILQAFGETDVDTVIAELKQAEALKAARSQTPAATTDGSNLPDETATQTQQLNAALTMLAEALGVPA